MTVTDATTGPRREDDDAGPSVPRSPMPSVDKALRAVIELAEAGTGGLGLGDLADRLSVKRSSLHVTLRALRHRSFVDQTAAGNYVLGSSLLAAASLYYQNFDLRGVLRPTLLQAARDFNEVFHLAVLDGSDLLYLEKIESQRPIQPGTSIGHRLPALTTAMGRVLVGALYSDFAGFETRFRGRLTPRTASAPTTLEEEWGYISEARELGYAVDLEHNVAGLAAVAVAISFKESPVAAISIVTLAQDFYDKGAVHYANILRGVLQRDLHAPLELIVGHPIEP